MRQRPRLLAVTAATVLVIGLSGCGSNTDDPSDAGSDATGATLDARSDPSYDQALLDQRVADYQTYVVAESRTMLKATKIFTDAIRRGDVAAAKAEFANSRYHWETIEPIAGLVSAVDGAVDSRVDDFASVTDPAFTGWHRLEYMLWEDGKIDALSKKYATRLDKDLAPLPGLLEKMPMKAKDVVLGAPGLIEEVSEGKLTGEEDRYSHTDLYDIAANVNGSMRAFQVYEPILVKIDKPMELKIEQGFLDAKALLSNYQRPDGSYESYLELTKGDRQKLQALLATLSEDLSNVPGALAL